MTRIIKGQWMTQRDLFGGTAGYHLLCPHCKRNRYIDARKLRGTPVCHNLNLKCPTCGKTAQYGPTTETR